MFGTNAIVANMFVPNKFVARYHGCVDQTRPRSRRERPAKAPLSREAVVDAALAVLESDGIARLTMRRLAADLDTGPASLYVYVRSTTEVHALLIDRLLAGLDLGWDGEVDWRERLRGLLVDYIVLLMRHPGLAASAQVTWPDGPHYLDLVELVLRLLTAGGVPAERAAWGVDALLQQATAMAVEYHSRGEPDAGQDVAGLEASFATADAERHPVLTGVGAAQLISGDEQARRDWALTALINGVAGTPRPGE